MVLITITSAYADVIVEGTILDPPETRISYLLTEDINCTSINVFPNNLTLIGCPEEGVYLQDIISLYVSPLEIYQNDSLGCYLNKGTLSEELSLRWFDEDLNLIKTTSVNCNNNELCLADTLVNPNKNKEYSCLISFTESFYEGLAYADDFAEVINFVPIITNLLPSYDDFNVSEGDTIIFDVEYIDIDSEDTISVSWFLNGIKQASTKVWQWVVSHLIANPDNPFVSNNVTVYINDNDGGIVAYEWDIGVNEVNLAPVILDFYQTPTEISFDNNLIEIFCDVEDEYYNKTDLTVNISYKSPISDEFINLNVSLESDLFFSSILIDRDPLNVGLWSFRCQARDPVGDVFSQQTDFDSVRVVDVPVSPNTPSFITPTRGTFDSIINIECEQVTDPNKDDVFYDFYAEIILNNGSVSWIPISLNNSKNMFTWYVGNLREQENISLSCQAHDKELYSDVFESNTTIKIKRDFKVLIVPHSIVKKNYIFNKIPYSIICDVNSFDNVIIHSSYADCSNNGQWEYHFRYADKNRTITTDPFSCYYETEGFKTINAGCILQRVNESIAWDFELCKDTSNKEDFCLVERSVREELIK